ncbi:MAG: alpha-D-glucose phosphate-specific phosphoglucomutase, partial [Gammaproteobacteria bacterium]
MKPLKHKRIACTPYDDQRPGTAGLRKKVKVFQQPHYLECFVQAVFNAAELTPGATLVLGGDGRYFNSESIQIIAAMAAAQNVARLVIGQDGLMSTPAASHLIRKCGAAGGFLLTASHNPGGPNGDFGIKYNTASGGQADESLTENIYKHSAMITEYATTDLPPIDLSTPGSLRYEDIIIDIVATKDDYAEMMQGIFDFAAIKDLLQGGFRICIDAMHGVNGPYAKKIFCELLGAPPESIINSVPLPDFGGTHPDP